MYRVKENKAPSPKQVPLGARPRHEVPLSTHTNPLPSTSRCTFCHRCLGSSTPFCPKPKPSPVSASVGWAITHSMYFFYPCALFFYRCVLEFFSCQPTGVFLTLFYWFVCLALVLGMKSRASYRLSVCSTTQLCSKLLLITFNCSID